MKLELLAKPQIFHMTIGKNMPDLVLDYDKTSRTIGDALNVVGSKFLGLARHFQYAFYFHLPSDFLTEVLCYSDLLATRQPLDDESDEGILSGTIQEFVDAMRTFCRPETGKEIRAFFNAIGMFLEKDGIQLPFMKTDLQDKTYAITS